MTDVDLSRITPDQFMTYALSNVNGPEKESGYVVRHRNFVSQFGPGVERTDRSKWNPLMAAYPCLWPYGCGGIEDDLPSKIGFTPHVQWLLEYHDKRFRVHHSFP